VTPEVKAFAVCTAIAAAIITSGPAHASATCRTIDEARTAFPGAHLYWHGNGHCWDNNGRTSGHASAKHARGKIATPEPPPPDGAPNDPNGNDIGSNPHPAIRPIDPPPLIAMADGRLTVGAGIDDRIPTSRPPAPPPQEKVYSEDEYNFLDAQAAIQLATMQSKNHRMAIITVLMLTVLIVFILSSVLIRRPFARMRIESGPPSHQLA
jgi:hypothetical protein